MEKNKCANRGKQCQWPELEDSIAKWIEEKRQSGYIVTKSDQDMRSDQGITHFQATNSWCTKIPSKKELCAAAENHDCTENPEDLEEKVTSFHSFIIKRRKEKDYELVHIANMDETPVWFDMRSARTVNSRGEKTVLINTTDHEKSRFTVVLSCLADGTKLKPMPKEKFPPGMVVHCHQTGLDG